ncbi:hypothetical protein [Alkalilimnicola sp. S0819]|uniref:hypothetical protein n=1 Tax=Alkalilimnicola sp. S0819 TaxID=2613922 RepID=UPI0018698CD1|nr:hypothetical protein [Alkalilimnicola sp. S0819]
MSKPAKTPTRTTQPSREAILRSVASSTAIETGEPVSRIEARLRAGKSRFRDLPLG